MLHHDSRDSSKNEMLSKSTLQTIAKDLRKGFELFQPVKRIVTKREFRKVEDGAKDDLYKDIIQVMVITWYNMMNGLESKKVYSILDSALLV